MINTTCGTGVVGGGEERAGHEKSPPCLATVVCILDQNMWLVTLEEIHSHTAAANVSFVAVKNNQLWDD